ncbi:MAG TPA: hypothetical protein VN408_04650 [Actinoplanes sp.]|nr:hypothetical protein [Actinoplanes sp.]
MRRSEGANSGSVQRPARYRERRLVRALPEPGAECVVTGGLSGVNGRKATAGTTVYGPDGSATAYATWLAIV